MRETDFIRDHSTKWQDIEDALKTPSIEPDALRDMFVQVTDDLSYARTFYPNRSVRVYLNELAKRLFYSIYSGNTKESKRPRSFWMEELPLLMYGARRDMLIAFLVFWGAFIAGALSCAMDPDFPKVILGETYVKMTETNIASGDPMAVYKGRGQFDMAFGITANNLYVAFLSFVSGIFFAIGTLMIMVSNGVMVGTFQYFFVQQGLLQESFLTIWVHGTLEISAIIIAGGAGITMGRGLAFPGTYTRVQAFQQSARRGLKIFFGIAPIIILAALFESFLTRYTDTPDGVRGTFIFACLTFILVYFWWYPRHVAARTLSCENRDADLLAETPDFPELENIRSGDEIFRDVFTIMRHKISLVCTYALFATAIFCFPVFSLSGLPPQQLFSPGSGFLASLEALRQFYALDKVPWIPWLNIPIMAWISARLLPGLMGKPRQSLLSGLLPALKMLLPAGFFILIMQSEIKYAGIIMLICLPWLLCWASVIAMEKDPQNLGTQRTFSLLRANAFRALHVFLLLVLSAGLFFSLLDTALVWAFLNLTSWIIRIGPQDMEAFSAVLLAALTYFFHYVAFAFILAGFGLLHYTLKEIADAEGLRKKIERIGQKRLLRGLEQELPR